MNTNSQTKKAILLAGVVLLIGLIAYVLSNSSGKDGSSSLGYVAAGDAMQQEGRIELATEEYAKAFSLKPNDARIVRAYANGLILTKRYEEAYVVIDGYFNMNSKSAYQDDVVLWQERGVAALNTHRCAEAEASALRVFELAEKGGSDYVIAEAVMREAKGSCK